MYFCTLESGWKLASPSPWIALVLHFFQEWSTFLLGNDYIETKKRGFHPVLFLAEFNVLCVCVRALVVQDFGLDEAAFRRDYLGEFSSDMFEVPVLCCNLDPQKRFVPNPCCVCVACVEGTPRSDHCVLSTCMCMCARRVRVCLILQTKIWDPRGVSPRCTELHSVVCSVQSALHVVRQGVRVTRKFNVVHVKSDRSSLPCQLAREINYFQSSLYVATFTWVLWTFLPPPFKAWVILLSGKRPDGRTDPSQFPCLASTYSVRPYPPECCLESYAAEIQVESYTLPVLRCLSVYYIIVIICLSRALVSSAMSARRQRPPPHTHTWAY